MTTHISAKKDEISDKVIMPGDPLRAKYIAEMYLKEPKLVSSVRNIYAYTGMYNEKSITVIASGMGNSSMGIYSYELFKFYGVESIIRIGTAGAYDKKMQLKDIILVENSYSKSTYAICLNNNKNEILPASKELNDNITQKANEKNINIFNGNIHCSDVFYKENLNYEEPGKYNCIGVEMESFALFANAILTNKKAACLLTVSDIIGEKEILSPNERETSLNTMIGLALDSI